MTVMDETYGKRLGKSTIRFIRDMPQPIEEVWAYLTESDKRALWLAGGETSTEIGGKAVFEFDHSRITPHDEDIPEKYKKPDGTPEFDTRMVGEVMVYVPMTRLKVTWPEPNEAPSILDITVTDKKGRVELVLFHDKIPDDEFALSILAGWHAHLDILEARLKGETPEPFWENHTRLEAEYTENES